LFLKHSFQLRTERNNKELTSEAQKIALESNITDNSYHIKESNLMSSFSILKVNEEKDLFPIAKFCVHEFFGTGSSYNDVINLNQLISSHINEVKKRYDKNENVMFKIVNSDDNIVAFAELIRWTITKQAISKLIPITEAYNHDILYECPINEEDTNDDDKKYVLLMIANVAVQSNYRRHGLGTIIMNLCIGA
jgi:hypothetical protein